MKKRYFLFAFTALNFAFSVQANTLGVTETLAATIHITNNTDAYATAKIGKICTSSAGSVGIIAPHQSLTVPSYLLDFYCPFFCEAEVFMNQSCSGSSIATADISNQHGVTKIANNKVGHYALVGIGSEISIEGTA